MNRIVIVLLAMLVASPVYAQDWERVFTPVDSPEDSHRVLVLDTDVDRSETARYRILSTADLLAAALPASARLSYIASTSLHVTATASHLRLTIDGVGPESVPEGSIAMMLRPVAVPTGGGNVTVLFGTALAVPLRNLAGEAATWADLQARDIHVMVRSAGAWNLLH